MVRDVRPACLHLVYSDATVSVEVADARLVWHAVMLDILACVERGDTAGLLPTEWAVRTGFRDWFEANWFGKARRVFAGNPPPAAVRRLR